MTSHGHYSAPSTLCGERDSEKPGQISIVSNISEYWDLTLVLKSWMGSTHFQMKTIKRVSAEMSLHVLAYNLKRVIKILGTKQLIEAIQA